MSKLFLFGIKCNGWDSVSNLVSESVSNFNDLLNAELLDNGTLLSDKFSKTFSNNIN